MRGRIKKGSGFPARTRVLAFGFIFLVLICVARLYQLQVLQGAAYTAKADREFLEPSSPVFSRGTIYFTTKGGAEVPAATVESGVSLAMEPPAITDASALYDTLNALVPLSKTDFLADAAKPNAQYIDIADHLSTTTGAALEAQNLPGVVVAQDNWRSYPGGSLAAQTIGFVGYDGNVLDGRYGLERQYESTLSRTGNNLYVNFFVQLFSGAKQILNNSAQGDLVTTIEPSVQQELERELSVYMGEWHPQFAGGIIMDPQTGAIYAMAINPNFDPNNFSQVSDPSLFANPMVTSVYEMGSIIKPLTMATGIDTGAITATSTYDDTGCITVNTAKICNYDLVARGVIPMQQILSQSLNVGASYIATQVGPDRMRDYFTNRYEFGQKTGIDLPNEASGLISNLNSPRQLEYNEAAFGQGIAITPLETTRALAALANGGHLVVPHTVSAIQTTSGITEKLSWLVGPEIFSNPQTPEKVTQMLVNVVDTVLANGALTLAHWSIAAKTGTAQIAKPGGGGYISNVYLHSYFAYFPAYNPRFIIFTFAFKPVGAPYASETWSTIYHDLIGFLINYYNIPPDR